MVHVAIIMTIKDRISLVICLTNDEGRLKRYTITHLNFLYSVYIDFNTKLMKFCRSLSGTPKLYDFGRGRATSTSYFFIKWNKSVILYTIYKILRNAIECQSVIYWSFESPHSLLLAEAMFNVKQHVQYNGQTNNQSA